MSKRGLAWGLPITVAALLAAQLIPYGRDHANPPTQAEPPWASLESRALAVRACFDCHSNQTVWPWYASVAPVSWLIQGDVEAGRRELNFSRWDRPQREAREAPATVRRGEMPPWSYRWARSEAQLSFQERERLVAGLVATVDAARGDAGEAGGEHTTGGD